MKDFGFDDRIAEAERPNLGSIGGRKKNARTANVANSLKIRRGWINWRWLLLLVFVVGFSLTSPKLSTDWGYLALTIISIASCALLLSRLNVSLDISLPTWTILGVFIIGYYLKFYWIVLDPEILKDMGDVIWQHYSQGSLVPAFRLTTLGFTSFCLSAWAFLRPSRRHRLWKRPELPRAVYRSAAKVLFWLSPILMASTFIFAYRTGILVMGRENVQLPLRLAGVFLYTRTILIPALLLVLIYCADKSSDAFLKIAGIVFLILHGLSDVLLRSSRAQFAIMIMALAFLLLIINRKTGWAGSRIILVGLLIAILLIPILTEYRVSRIYFPGASITESLAWSIRSAFSTRENIGDYLGDGLRFILLRVTGVEMVLTYTSIGPVPLGTSVLNIIQSGETLTTYSNKNVLRIPEYSNTALATSLVGWFYLVGGGLLVVIGMFLFVAFFDFIWNHMRWYRLRMLPAAQALILMWLLFVSSEGTIDSQGYFLVVILTSLLFCEWLMKRIEHSIKRI